jgi:transposase-like protein
MNIIQIYKIFPTQEDCIKHIENIKWSNKPVCPYCKSNKHTPVTKEKRYHCNTCNTSYSVTVDTIFHNTKLPLQKWFLAISLIINAKKGIASRQLARDIEVTKDTAWRMQMQIRKAMGQYKELLQGIIEMDETYVGGKPRPGTGEHKRGRGTKKTPVVGIVERNGNVKAKVQNKDKLKFKSMKKIVNENVDKKNSVLMTDEYKGYLPMSSIIEHKTVNHSEGQYSNGDIHTNTIGSFWAILKRGIFGQYHHVSKRYLNKYINEFCFKYNNRKNKSDDIFRKLLLNGVNL